jgi:LDH2 family malate/lactate/ureidoglycolate dehydrogenase
MAKPTNKVVGTKRLSGMDGFRDVMIPGGHATPERRAQRDFSKKGISVDQPEMDDHKERAARYGF